MNASTLLFPVLPWNGRLREPLVHAVTGALFVSAMVWLAESLPGWAAMGSIALAVFFTLKLVLLRGYAKTAPRGRLAAFIFLWPGMDAAAFLAPRTRQRGDVAGREIAFALGKMTLGLGLGAWALRHADSDATLLVGWIGMLGIIFTAHFGFFHVLSCAWRAAGVDARPIMRAPIAARALAEFWGERWNVAFAYSARRLLLRPLARRWGVARAGAVVFLVSGLVHELVISLPAHGGWGGPTLYFLLQAAGMAAEKSGPGRRLGLGVSVVGRGWTLAITALPLPLLFHAPFAERVIVPLYRFLKEVL